MEAKGLVRSHQIDSVKPTFWMLPGVSLLRESKYRHEIASADLYVAFHNLCDFWERHEDAETEYDRKMVLRETPVYFEVDLATESPRVIQGKLEGYRKLYQKTRGRFYVIFSLKAHRENVTDRGNKIIPLIKSMGIGGQFYLLANHDKLIRDPLGDVLYSPVDNRSTGLLEVLK